MNGAMLQRQFSISRIVHHYFFQAGSTMRRFPRHSFSRHNPNHRENRRRLANVIKAERKAKRMDQWLTGTPEPFAEHRVLLFPGY